jgi:hypothetical protein
MTTKLDPRIEAVRVKYGLEPTDFWELPQKKGTYVAKHSALEVAAAKAGITFDNPIIIEANSEAGIAALSVAGSDANRREWATGEASPKNNKNAYPWAMAEKRAKDRVILKLIGIHGLVYSEDEMSGSGAEREEQRRDEGADEDGVIQSNPTSKQHFKTIYDDITACTTLKQLQGAWERHQPVVKVLSEEHRKMLMERKNEMKEYLSENAAAAANGQKPVNTYNFDNLAPAHQ